METSRSEQLKRIKANRAGDSESPAPRALTTNEMLRHVGGMVSNALSTRNGWLAKMFDTRRDIDEECGYPKVISDELYRRMYDRGLGRRVVNIYTEETWKEFPSIYEDPDADKDTPFELVLEEINKRHHLLHYLQRADELSGVGNYGIILWGIDDGLTLDTPVAGCDSWEEASGIPTTPPKSAPVANAAEEPGEEGEDEDDEAREPAVALPTMKRRLLFIRVLDSSLVTIADYEQDVTKPRYGLPTYYNITMADPRNLESDAVKSPPGHLNAKVHWSRVTHIADNRKTSEVLGSPRQEPVWDRLCDLRKVLSGSGEMFWRGGFPGISLETQPDAQGGDIDQDANRQMMQDYMDGLQRYLSLDGMSAKSLAPQIADPTASFEVQIKAICIIIGVPFRVFMGIEEGVVSGDQATRAWEGRLTNRQTRYITPMIIDPVLQRLIDYGILPDTKKPRGWCVEWPDAMEATGAEKADLAAKLTEALAKYVAGGVDVLIPPLEYLTLICGLDDETAQSIIEASVTHIEEGDTFAAQAAELATETQVAVSEATTAHKTDSALAVAAATPPPLPPGAPGAKPAPGGKTPPPKAKPKPKK